MTPATVRPVRPRDAASLILLRQGAGGIEALLGRRGAGARFMPGRYVFPGGGIRREDARPFPGETPAPAGTAALLGLARAALRETFEETGYLLGRPLAGAAARNGAEPPSAVAAAYAAARLAPAVGELVPIGRAITPTFSPIRFHARFFIADGTLAHGPVHPGEELEEVRWYRIDDGFPLPHGSPHGFPMPMSGVTQFMLRHALAVFTGTAPTAMPLYRHIGRVAKIEWRPLESRG
jgi:8-oxo-dGTP pyrophosphatase MutT (NUDIX family)